MSTMRKGQKAGNAEQAKSVKPGNLPAGEMDDQQADKVRGGKPNFQDLPVVKVIDKSSTK